ncbi:hypothetical protein NPIL_14201, partial [Nephila pilipes]
CASFSCIARSMHAWPGFSLSSTLQSRPRENEMLWEEEIPAFLGQYGVQRKIIVAYTCRFKGNDSVRILNMDNKPKTIEYHCIAEPVVDDPFAHPQNFHRRTTYPVVLNLERIQRTTLQNCKIATLAI